MNTLERGFYYHYKHDDAGDFNNYAYEVVGISMHTEDRTYAVLYRPLYANTYLAVDYSARPLQMFMETVSKDGKELPRFRKITDPEILEKLSVVRDEMYPSIS